MSRTLYFTVLIVLFLFSIYGAPRAFAQTKRLVEVPISDAPSYAKRALVIGVTDYALAPQLHVCANDAKEFATLLKLRFGFSDVTLMTDDPATPLSLRPTCANLRRAVHGLLKGIVPGKSEVVLFYSGHGVRYGDSDWLVPEDGDPSDISRSCVNYSVIVQALNTERPKRAFLVTDACRSLLSGKGVGGSGFGKGLESLPLGPEVAEILSCQPTEVSQEGLATDFPESVFTHFLVKGLEGDPDALAEGTKNVTFDSLMEYVQGHVSNYVRSRFNASQVPDGRATQGRMVLARVSGSTPPPITTPVILSPPLPVINPRPVGNPPITPEQQQQANAQLIGLWTNADGTWNDAKAQALTVAAVQQALDAGADINVGGKDGDTALINAVGSKHTDVVGLLLDKGADVNARDKNGMTALINAARSDQADVARLLLDKGADVNAKDIKGRTARSYATARHHDAVAALLQAAEAVSPNPATPIPAVIPSTRLVLAPDQQKAADARMVSLYRGSDGRYNEAAAQAVTVAEVQQALNQGADVNSGIGPAVRYGRTDIVRFQLDKGADIEARDKFGGTLLIGASFWGQADIVRLLLDRGANVHAKKYDGWTALRYARQNKRHDIAAMLKAAGEQE